MKSRHVGAVPLIPVLAARDKNPRRGVKRMILLLLVLNAIYISYPPASPGRIRSGSPESDSADPRWHGDGFEADSRNVVGG